MAHVERIGDDGEGLGARMRSARRALDLPASVLAAEVGLTEGAIRLIEERKVKAPSVFVALRAAKALGVSVDYLAFGVGDATTTRARHRKRTPQDDLDDALGDRVRRLREDAGLTADELADACGLSRDVIVRLEGGAKHSSFAIGVRIADALGVDPRWLALGSHSRTAARFEALEERLAVVERTVPRRTS